MWTLTSAAEYLKPFHEGGLRYGYALAIGGGVLRRGHSNHDLDVSCAPVPGRGSQEDFHGFFHWLLKEVSQVQGTSIQYWGSNQFINTVKTFAPGPKVIDWFVVMPKNLPR